MDPTRRLNPNVHKLVLSEALSKLGDNFTEVALALFILSLTRNNVAALGLVLAMAYVPRVVLGWAVAGVIDRLPKRSVLLIANGVRALLVVSIPVIAHYTWAVVAVFFMYTFAMLYQPVIRAIQPQIAETPEMNMKSQARQETYFALADIGGYLAAAGVLFVWGLTPAFFLDAATFVGAGLLVAAIRAPGTVWQAGELGDGGFWGQLGEGIGYLRQTATVRNLVLMTGLVALGVGALNTLLAPLSRILWHVSSKHYVWLLLALALGSLISGILIERLGLLEKYPARLLLALGFLLSAIGFGLVGLVSDWRAGALCLALVGFGNSFYSSALLLWVQTAVPDLFRGRTLAVRGALMGIGGALGAGLGGLLANSLGLQPAVLLTAAVWIAATVWSAASRSFRQGAPRKQTA
ncbi:MFS transporter [Sulfobacillus harzensis]|uniref:MFS transporter n=1 Tax=Sulfobacillus harzensis TaxID=2729629 RepID=A0A7Y0L0J5_9FIRM|nr:MFS transporter [Sulfobacillus harzensis]NMP20995.1 MFS transporter [Sulfobacillus harzensis]